MAASMASGPPTRPCAVWMARSTLPAAGRGLFARRAPRPMPALRLPTRQVELTQLAAYVFAGPKVDGEALGTWSFRRVHDGLRHVNTWCSGSALLL